MPWIVGLFAFSIAYAIVRYVVFAPKNIEHIPVFVVNKGLSMAAALSFSIAFVLQWTRRRRPQSTIDPTLWFRAGLFGVVAHVPMSLAILQPGYFKEFFLADSPRMSLGGEMVFLLGALAASLVFLAGRQTLTPAHRWWVSLLFMLSLAGHVLSMGIARGLNINRSHAYLPPMWLLSLIGVVMGFGFLALTRPRAGRAGQTREQRQSQ